MPLISFDQRFKAGLMVPALLALLAGLTACSNPPASPPVQEAPSSDQTDDPVGYFLQMWGAQDASLDGPMYQPLPIGVDPRGWGLMRQGYLAHARKEEEAKNRTVEEPYQRDYEFSWDVFTMNIPLWREVLGPVAGKPNLRYLEVGISEGRATLWILENILTDPTSRAVGIDPFMVKEHEQILLNNLQKYGQPEKIELIKGFSQEALPRLQEDSFDIIYIDGSHLAGDVLLDAVYSWRLLKPGGLVIHDDYIWEFRRGLPSELTPLVSIDAFVTSMRNTLEVVHRGDQIILRKLPNQLPDFCWNRNPCSRVGDYYYAWTSKTFYRLGTTDRIELTESERTVLESLLQSRRFGAEAERLISEDVAEIRARHPKEFDHFAKLLKLQM